ncbi:dihydrofolate reductase [Coemansia sp. RSA 1290]|nr:dihydrofolate reductase [Coemansia sp. RSA 1290]KAJ2651488.1 dihydrofolate reductase [Coemansia sp. RSA 1250]
MPQKPLVLVAAAAAKNNGIGVNNDLPWRLRKELAYFTRVTRTLLGSSDEKLGDVPRMNACIMGRATWESIPPKHRPLDGRFNIVLTSNPHLLAKENPPFSITQPSMQAALRHIDQLNAAGTMRIDRVFVVGGSSIYEEALRVEDRHIQVLLTRVQFDDAERCDKFFPEIDPQKFSLQPHARLEQVAGFDVPCGVQSESGISYQFLLYEKNAV